MGCVDNNKNVDQIYPTQVYTETCFSILLVRKHGELKPGGWDFYNHIQFSGVFGDRNALILKFFLSWKKCDKESQVYLH